MIAAEFAVERRQARRAAELAHSDDENVALQAALVDIFDQCGKGLIHVRGAPAHALGKVPTGLGVRVIVPAKVDALVFLRSERVNGDDAGAGFGKSSREQATLDPEMPA